MKTTLGWLNHFDEQIEAIQTEVELKAAKEYCAKWEEKFNQLLEQHPQIMKEVI